MVCQQIFLATNALKNEQYTTEANVLSNQLLQETASSGNLGVLL